jgi:hypothetical protein
LAEILEVFSSSRRLYAPDSLPWPQLASSSGVERLRERYRFTGVQPFSTTHLVAQAGEFAIDKRSIPVQSLVLQPNSVEYQIAGETADGELLYADLVRFIGEIGRFDVTEYAKTFQTIAIAKLAVSSDQLLSPTMQKYLTEVALPAFEVDQAEPHVQLGNLSWIVSYQTKTTDFFYQPRPFTIEPRAGSRLEDRLYYTLSPTDSKSHVRLLEKLEKYLPSPA